MIRQFMHWIWHLSYFYVTWVTFLGTALISFVILYCKQRGAVSFRSFANYCFPFEAWKSKSVRMDILLWALAKVVVLRDIPLIGSAAAVAVLTSSSLKRALPGFAIVHPTAWVIAAAIICLFVFKEFVDYAVHYAQHRVPLLWELHKVHHSALHLVPLTAKRGHPLEMIMQGVIVGVANGAAFGACGFLIGLSVPQLILWTGILNKVMTVGSLDTLRHSHFSMSFGWLDRLFISPHMHHIHHSRAPQHWDKNFGTNLSIFDWLFGTAYKPGRTESIAYGIGDEEEEHTHFTVLGVLVGPLVRMWKLAAAMMRPASPSQQAQATEVVYVPGRVEISPARITPGRTLSQEIAPVESDFVA